MRAALIAGTGINKTPGWALRPQTVETIYGSVELFLGEDEFADLVFLPRHGSHHQVPPHRINYRANLKALQRLEVERVLAIFTVGSLNEAHPPHSISALDQFIDFTHGRLSTFFEGGDSGLVHTEMTESFCTAIRERILNLARNHNLQILPSGTYVCVEGPRFETAAEIRMFAQLGGDVVGMTAVPEIPLARELGLHYAAIAISVNWGAGLKGALKIEEQGLKERRSSLLDLCLEVLQSPLDMKCSCQEGRIVIHAPSPEAGD
jgi:5'-methylthioadenosine phosphorylase